MLESVYRQFHSSIYRVHHEKMPKCLAEERIRLVLWEDHGQNKFYGSFPKGNWISQEGLEAFLERTGERGENAVMEGDCPTDFWISVTPAATLTLPAAAKAQKQWRFTRTLWLGALGRNWRIFGADTQKDWQGKAEFQVWVGSTGLRKRSRTLSFSARFVTERFQLSQGMQHLPFSWSLLFSKSKPDRHKINN